MKKTLFIALTIIALPIMGMDLTPDHQEPKKTIVTFPIVIKPIIHPIKVGDDFYTDQKDRDGCRFLDIEWTKEKGKPLWQIHEVYYTQDETKRHSGLQPLSIDLFNSSKNKNRFATGFKFPTTLPDTFIQELVKKGTITHEFEKTTAHFVLQNTPQSLEELGLKTPEKPKEDLSGNPTAKKIKLTDEKVKKSNSVFLIGGAFVGIAGLIAWFLTTDDTNPYKAQILNFFYSLMPAKP